MARHVHGGNAPTWDSSLRHLKEHQQTLGNPALRQVQVLPSSTRAGQHANAGSCDSVFVLHLYLLNSQQARSRSSVSHSPPQNCPNAQQVSRSRTSRSRLSASSIRTSACTTNFLHIFLLSIWKRRHWTLSIRSRLLSVMQC